MNTYLIILLVANIISIIVVLCSTRLLYSIVKIKDENSPEKIGGYQPRRPLPEYFMRPEPTPPPPRII